MGGDELPQGDAPGAEVDPWVRLGDLLAGTDFTSLTLAVVDLSAEQRRAVVKALRAYVAPGKYQPTVRLNLAGAAIIGAGVLPDAKSLTAWLTRYDMRHHSYLPEPHRYVETSVVPHVFYVLTQRDVPWLSELVSQIAQRLPREADFGRDRFELACRLIEHIGMPVPTTPGFVAGWVHDVSPKGLADDLAARPAFAVLIPHVFDVEQIGAKLSHDERWPAAIADVAARGLADRAALLDACLARLIRDGRPGATRAFLAVHEALAPTSAEVSGRRDAYLAMVVVPASTVASVAQARLFELDERGLLPPADQLELARAALRRPEKKLVRAQLGRIAKLAPLDADRKAEFARLIISSWAGTDADLVRKGMQTIVALRLSESARRGLVDLVPAGLPADLAGELGRIAGAAGAAATVTATQSVRSAPQRIPLEPISDLDAIVALLQDVLSEKWAGTDRPASSRRVRVDVA